MSKTMQRYIRTCTEKILRNWFSIRANSVTTQSVYEVDFGIGNGNGEMWAVSCLRSRRQKGAPTQSENIDYVFTHPVHGLSGLRQPFVLQHGTFQNYFVSHPTKRACEFCPLLPPLFLIPSTVAVAVCFGILCFCIPSTRWEYY